MDSLAAYTFLFESDQLILCKELTATGDETHEVAVAVHAEDLAKYRDLLVKILGAVKLSLDHVALVTEEPPARKYQKTIFFGFGKNDYQASGNTVHSDKLEDLEYSPELKKKLWLALKELFGI